MITLTSDKFAPVKVSFSIKDPVYQGPGRSTPRQVARPGSSRPTLERQSTAAPVYTVRQDKTMTVGEFCCLASQPQFIGRCMRQNSPSTSAPTWEILVTKQSKARRWHPQKLPWTPAMSTPRVKNTAGQPSPDSKDDISCLGPYLSCNLIRVIRKLYHGWGTQTPPIERLLPFR
jgi:hypothetical protein